MQAYDDGGNSDGNDDTTYVPDTLGDRPQLTTARGFDVRF